MTPRISVFVRDVKRSDRGRLRTTAAAPRRNRCAENIVHKGRLKSYTAAVPQSFPRSSAISVIPQFSYACQIRYIVPSSTECRWRHLLSRREPDNSPPHLNLNWRSLERQLGVRNLLRYSLIDELRVLIFGRSSGTRTLPNAY